MNRPPKMLDLFCGAGGAGYGYLLAGFHVTGVDLCNQPRYAGHRFIRGDALSYLKAHWQEFDCFHASPPCQRFSPMTQLNGTQNCHPDLIQPLRDLLIHTGLPYVIENVPGAPLLNPTALCGSMFGLRLRRHRLFETNFSVPQLPCRHKKGQKVVGVYGNSGGSSKRGDVMFDLKTRKAAMRIDWMSSSELSQAIPPAYTERVGYFLMRHLNSKSLL